jgi:hypothetical protein
MLESLGQQVVDGASIQLSGTPPEELLGLAIGEEDAPVLVGQQDPVGCDVDESMERGVVEEAAIAQLDVRGSRPLILGGGHGLRPPTGPAPRA